MKQKYLYSSLVKPSLPVTGMVKLCPSQGVFSLSYINSPTQRSCMGSVSPEFIFQMSSLTQTVSIPRVHSLNVSPKPNRLFFIPPCYGSQTAIKIFPWQLPFAGVWDKFQGHSSQYVLGSNLTLWFRFLIVWQLPKDKINFYLSGAMAFQA